jgi:hypothetical protein
MPNPPRTSAKPRTRAITSGAHKASLPATILERHESGASDSWSWEASLSRSSDGSYRAELSQQLWDGDDDTEPSVYESHPLRSGRELFEFLQASWITEHEEPLDEEAWREVVESVESVDAALGGELRAAVGEEFGEPADAPRRPPTALQQCVAGATWERTQHSGGGAMWASVADSRRAEQALAFFIHRFQNAHGMLPRGPHHVRVTFGRAAEGADCEPGSWAGGDGVFDKIVHFPEIE